MKAFVLSAVLSCLLLARAEAGQPQTDSPEVPTAAELVALIEKATRIEAKSASGQKPTWSKDLTKADIAKLKAGIGKAEISPYPPRCLPTVIVILYEQNKELAKLGAFCDGDKVSTLMRYDIGKTIGSLTPQDIEKVSAALESPVDE